MDNCSPLTQRSEGGKYERRNCTNPVSTKSDSYILVLTAMDFSSQEPEIYFHEIPETGRLELIKVLRSRDKANE